MEPPTFEAGEKETLHSSLRWVVVHMIEETARHTGHADVVRELLDGATGYKPAT